MLTAGAGATTNASGGPSVVGPRRALVTETESAYAPGRRNAGSRNATKAPETNTPAPSTSVARPEAAATSTPPTAAGAMRAVCSGGYTCTSTVSPGASSSETAEGDTETRDEPPTMTMTSLLHPPSPPGAADGGASDTQPSSEGEVPLGRVHVPENGLAATNVVTRDAFAQIPHAETPGAAEKTQFRGAPERLLPLRSSEGGATSLLWSIAAVRAGAGSTVMLMPPVAVVVATAAGVVTDTMNVAPGDEAGRKHATDAPSAFNVARENVGFDVKLAAESMRHTRGGDNAGSASASSWAPSKSEIVDLGRLLGDSTSETCNATCGGTVMAAKEALSDMDGKRMTVTLATGGAELNAPTA